eukprot:g22730.t1
MSGFINFNSFDVKKALKRKKGQISSDSDSEQQAKAKAKPKAKPKAQPEPVPLHQLAATATDLSGVAVVSRFLASALAEWRRLRPSSETLEKLQDAGQGTAGVCRMSLANEHLAAERVYLELTIGNSKWPIGGGEFLSSDGPQPGNRMWGQKLRKIKETASMLDRR